MPNNHIIDTPYHHHPKVHAVPSTTGSPEKLPEPRVLRHDGADLRELLRREEERRPLQRAALVLVGLCYLINFYSNFGLIGVRKKLEQN